MSASCHDHYQSQVPVFQQLKVKLIRDLQYTLVRKVELGRKNTWHVSLPEIKAVFLL